jgi:plasmid stabilization system protein ParE
MTRTLRIIELARNDVDEIFGWLARRSVRGAVAWYLAFRRAVEGIAASPDLLEEAPESGLLGRPLRETLFKTRRGRSYRIVVELSSAGIVILRVRGPGQPRLRRRELPDE